MPSLRELQRSFALAISDGGKAASVAPMFRGSRQRAIARLAVYRGNVYGNRAKALAGAYPIVRKIVGENFFEAMAREYARAHPSRSGDLNGYGEHFAAFVAAFPHTADLPYLPDVAQMEWFAHRAYFAADPAPFDVAAVRHIPPQRYLDLRVALAAACALMQSPWPLGRIWIIHQDDYRGPFEIDLDSGPDCILVHRPRWRAEVLSLSTGDFRFLQSLSQGETLGTALEAGAGVPEFDPSAALARWIAAGVVVDLV